MALQPKYLPGNTESWHLDQICPVFIAPVSTRSLRWPTPPCTRPLTGLCGDSEVEGNGTGGGGGWLLQHTHRPTVLTSGLEKTRVPQGGVWGGAGWGTYFVSMQILWFSSCSHPCDTKCLLVPPPAWHGSSGVPRVDVLRGVEVTRIQDCILCISYLLSNAHSGGVWLSGNVSEAPLHVANTSTSVVLKTSAYDLFSLYI